MAHGITRLMRAIRKPPPRVFWDSGKNGTYFNHERDEYPSKRARRRKSRWTTR